MGLFGKTQDRPPKDLETLFQQWVRCFPNKADIPAPKMSDHKSLYIESPLTINEHDAEPEVNEWSLKIRKEMRVIDRQIRAQKNGKLNADVKEPYVEEQIDLTP